MRKLDLRKQFMYLYAPSAKNVEVVTVPKLSFVMIDGLIEAGLRPADSPDFQTRMMALYGLAFTLKFMSKLRKKDPIDYPVMALEGLWWTRSGGFNFSRSEPWYYTLMVMQPGHVTQSMFRDALGQVREKRPSPALEQARLERFEEGLSMQIMHIGPYSTEPETIELMKAFAHEHGYLAQGKHHEIYLGDPRRAKPEKLRTILRQPIVKRDER